MVRRDPILSLLTTEAIEMPLAKARAAVSGNLFIAGSGTGRTGDGAGAGGVAMMGSCGSGVEDVRARALNVGSGGKNWSPDFSASGVDGVEATTGVGDGALLASGVVVVLCDSFPWLVSVQLRVLLSGVIVASAWLLIAFCPLIPLLALLALLLG